MPEKYDPRWEYYEPDPYVSYVFDKASELKHPSIRGIPCLEYNVEQSFQIRSLPGGKQDRGKFESYKEVFRQMWMDGCSVLDLVKAFSIDMNTVRLWRKKLKLPPRMRGNYHKKTKAEYARLCLMKEESAAMKPIREIFRSYAEFDSLGKHINGTDKESNHHYGDAYARIIEDTFAPRHGVDTARNQVNLMMEVGVADGSCLLAWREVFPNALIVGMDIHHSDKAHGERIEFYLGNQRIKGDCDSVAAGRQFDMIVEDATHQLDDTLRTLLYLWPYVRPGGIYVVEEFENIGVLRNNVKALWPNVEIIGTCGPHIADEPLVVFRKSL